MVSKGELTRVIVSDGKTEYFEGGCLVWLVLPKIVWCEVEVAATVVEGVDDA